MKKVLMKQLHYVARQKNRVQPLAYSVYSGPPRPVDSHKPLHKMPAPDKLAGDPETIRILTGGSIEAPSDEVAPGVISAMAGSNAAVSPSDWNTIPDDAGSRRLAFARWIAWEVVRAFSRSRAAESRTFSADSEMPISAAAAV